MRNTHTIADGAYTIYYGNFYKYLGVEGAIKTLETGKLKFSNPKMFNDPLDCSEILLTHFYGINKKIIEEGIKDEIELIKVLKKFVSHSDFYDKKKAEEMINRIDYNVKKGVKFSSDSINSLIKIFNGLYLSPVIREEVKKYKICCFSRNYRFKYSTLMWSHYAENHFGICLGFNLTELMKDKFKALAKKSFIPQVVQYRSSLQQTDILSDTLFKDWILQKLNVWEYEKEVRIINKTNDKRKFVFYTFPRDALKKVIFGFHTKKADILRIKSILEIKYDINKLIFEKMAIDPHTFQFKPYPYKIDKMQYGYNVKKGFDNIPLPIL